MLVSLGAEVACLTSRVEINSEGDLESWNVDESIYDQLTVLNIGGGLARRKRHVLHFGGGAACEELCVPKLTRSQSHKGFRRALGPTSVTQKRLRLVCLEKANAGTDID